jgi:hypothetical protein
VDSTLAKSETYKYMDMSQWNSLYLKQTKISFFKNEGKEGKTGSVLGLVPVWWGGRGCKEKV